MSSKLEVAFDPGSSLTKSFYRVDEGTPRAFLMTPEVLKVPVESVRRKPAAGVITPNNDAWIRFTQRGPTSSECFVVGLLAKQLSADASAQMRNLKHENAFVKLLALVGAISETEQIISDEPDQAIQLSVCIALPWGEFSDKERLEEVVKKRIGKFFFRDKQVNCQLENLAVTVEGSGFALNSLQSKGSDWFSSQERMYCLMLGHRNSSLITFQSGRVDPQCSETTDLGFIQIVEKVKEQVSGLSPEDLSSYLYKIEDDTSPENIDLKDLMSLRTQAVEASKGDLQEAAKVIDIARKEYFQLFGDWIGNLTKKPGTMYIGGGFGYYLRHFLADCKPLKRQDLIWGKPSPFIHEASARFGDASLNRRLIDSWYLFDYFYLPSEKNEDSSATGSTEDEIA